MPKGLQMSEDMETRFQCYYFVPNKLTQPP